MRKADYIKIAECIIKLDNMRKVGLGIDVPNMLYVFPGVLMDDNENFDYKKFRDYINKGITATKPSKV